jgi:hypothetical protein
MTARGTRSRKAPNVCTASPVKHDRLRELGAIPMDYRQPRLADRVREITLGGVAAVFDHGTGPGLHESWRLLARGGRLVVYGATSTWMTQVGGSLCSCPQSASCCGGPCDPVDDSGPFTASARTRTPGRTSSPSSNCSAQVNFDPRWPRGCPSLRH